MIKQSTNLYTAYHQCDSFVVLPGAVLKSWLVQLSNQTLFEHSLSWIEYANLQAIKVSLIFLPLSPINSVP